MAPRRISTFHHKTGSPHNFYIHYPICLTFLTLHQGSVLNSSVSQYGVTLIAPPTGETGSPHNFYIHYPICLKFLTLHKGSVLNSSVSQYGVTLIAPPTGETGCPRNSYMLYPICLGFLALHAPTCTEVRGPGHRCLQL